MTIPPFPAPKRKWEKLPKNPKKKTNKKKKKQYHLWGVVDHLTFSLLCQLLTPPLIELATLPSVFLLPTSPRGSLLCSPFHHSLPIYSLGMPSWRMSPLVLITNKSYCYYPNSL